MDGALCRNTKNDNLLNLYPNPYGTDIFKQRIITFFEKQNKNMFEF